jgi:two-component system, OmpR family, sensor histidine kinase KdpD
VEALPAVSARFAGALGLPWASIALGAVAPGAEQRAFALQDDGRAVGTLLVPAQTPAGAASRIERHVVPALEALLAAASEREQLLADVVETAALRRSDVLKTALLRAMSHDLRSPLTAILTAKEALGSPSLTPAEHEELVEDIGTEATRLSRLVDKLLDLSQLEAGSVAPQPGWCSVPEVLESAVAHLALPKGTFALDVSADVPQVRADAAQLERALANLLENASRFSGGHPVVVRARHRGTRVLVRIVDRGPGIREALRERVFEPFVRGDDPGGHRGSGLGLAIARGFIEANGGRVVVESVRGQGTTFVVDFPVPAADRPLAEAPA